MRGFAEEKFILITRGPEREIILPFARVSYKDHFLIKVDIAENTEVDIPHVDQIREAVLFITEGEPFAALYTAGYGVTYKMEVLKHTRDTEKLYPTLLARALAIDSLALKLVANFYLKFHKPEIPYKVFSAEKEAIHWLYTFKE